MNSVISTEKKPIKLWLPPNQLDALALKQLQNLANMPCIFKHVAAMPDTHGGYEAPVGSVVATKRAVIPGAVGLDGGCGMMAAKTSLRACDLPSNLEELFIELESVIPVGQAAHVNRHLPDVWDLDLRAGYCNLPEVLKDDEQRVVDQLGTLGGGNHFLEVCLDTHQYIWIMLHSGSRGIGNRIGKYYMDKAKSIMDAYFIELTDPNLAYLAEGTKEFEEYWRAMQWAQRYAMANRHEMMAAAQGALFKVLGKYDSPRPKGEVTFTVNCHHNYAEREHHYGENVIVTRKGAVRARPDDYGIVPGSMGARSFIVRGRGNPESFNSCSHGAGRLLTRTEAKKQFTEQDLLDQTTGVFINSKIKNAVEEIPSAYKPIQEVMDNQPDLVEIEATLKQVLCLKG